jgi:hypothetical protein
MTLDDARNIATILGVAVAVATFLKVILEYGHQGAQKRFEYFVLMRKRFKENPSFTKMCDLLEDDDDSLSGLSFKDKRDFLGFFEEVAIMVFSGLIRKEIALHMFGYYAIDCWKSAHFWANLDRDSPFVSLFKGFALEMLATEPFYRFRRRKYRI